MIRRISRPTCIYITLVRKTYIDVTCLSGDSSGSSSFAATIAVASLCLVVSVVQKEERETKGKNLQSRVFKKKERGVLVPF